MAQKTVFNRNMVNARVEVTFHLLRGNFVVRAVSEATAVNVDHRRGRTLNVGGVEIHDLVGVVAVGHVLVRDGRRRRFRLGTTDGGQERAGDEGEENSDRATGEGHGTGYGANGRASAEAKYGTVTQDGATLGITVFAISLS